MGKGGVAERERVSERRRGRKRGIRSFGVSGSLLDLDR